METLHSDPCRAINIVMLITFGVICIMCWILAYRFRNDDDPFFRRIMLVAVLFSFIITILYAVNLCA